MTFVDPNKDFSHSPHHLGTRARSALIWVGSTTVVWQALSWILTIFTARLLDPSDYGLMALTEAIFPYLTLVATFKVESWAIQNSEYGPHEERTVFTLTLFLGILATIGAIASAGPIANYYQRPEYIFPIQVAASIFAVRVFQIVPDIRLRRDLNFKPLAICNLTIGFVRGVLQLILAYYGYGYWALILGSLFKEVATTIWLVFVGGLTRKLQFDSKIALSIFTFGYLATFSSVFSIIASTADNLIVGKLFGLEVLGYYSMAFFLTELPISKLNTVVAPVLSPYYARMKVDRDAVHQAFIKTSRVFVSLLAPVLVGMAVEANDGILIFLDVKWAPIILPFQVLCLVSILRSLTTNTSTFLFALNEPGKVLYYTFVSALILPLAFFLLGSRFGLNGIYFSWLVIYPLIVAGTILPITREVTGVTEIEFIRQLRPPLVASALMAAICLFLVSLLGSLPPILRLCLVAMLGAVTYASSFWILFPRQWMELVGLFHRKDQNELPNLQPN